MTWTWIFEILLHDFKHIKVLSFIRNMYFHAWNVFCELCSSHPNGLEQSKSVSCQILSVSSSGTSYTCTISDNRRLRLSYLQLTKVMIYPQHVYKISNQVLENNRKFVLVIQKWKAQKKRLHLLLSLEYLKTWTVQCSYQIFWSDGCARCCCVPS